MRRCRPPIGPRAPTAARCRDQRRRCTVTRWGDMGWWCRTANARPAPGSAATACERWPLRTLPLRCARRVCRAPAGSLAYPPAGCAAIARIPARTRSVARPRAPTWEHSRPLRTPNWGRPGRRPDAAACRRAPALRSRAAPDTVRSSLRRAHIPPQPAACVVSPCATLWATSRQQHSAPTVGDRSRADVDDGVSWGVWLRRRRKALDLTQAELAQRAGCVAGYDQAYRGRCTPAVHAACRPPGRPVAAVAELRATFLLVARGGLGWERLPAPVALSHGGVPQGTSASIPDLERGTGPTDGRVAKERTSGSSA